MMISPINNNSISPYSLQSGRPVDENSAQMRAMKRSGLVECETCASRKYQDGSNESDVSFKAPGHISPAASGATVAAHERQHVANAYQKAGEAGNARVVQASVSLKTSVCPECGRTYVSGGVTHSMIKYNGDAYAQNTKSRDVAAGIIGSVVNYAV